MMMPRVPWFLLPDTSTDTFRPIRPDSIASMRSSLLSWDDLDLTRNTQSIETFPMVGLTPPPAAASSEDLSTPSHSAFSQYYGDGPSQVFPQRSRSASVSRASGETTLPSVPPSPFPETKLMAVEEEEATSENEDEAVEQMARDLGAVLEMEGDEEEEDEEDTDTIVQEIGRSMFVRSTQQFPYVEMKKDRGGNTLTFDFYSSRRTQIYTFVVARGNAYVVPLDVQNEFFARMVVAQAKFETIKYARVYKKARDRMLKLVYVSFSDKQQVVFGFTHDNRLFIYDVYEKQIRLVGQELWQAGSFLKYEQIVRTRVSKSGRSQQQREED
jgi:hypothetical protein